MREYGQFVKDCPKCGSFMLDRPAITWRDASATYGDGTVGSHDYFEPEHLNVECRCCGWSYEMRTKDAVVDVAAR